MIVDRTAVAEHLLDAVTRVEPYVALVRGSQGMLVRKLTVAEKLAHSEQTGASAFMADETEQEEFFRPARPAGRALVLLDDLVLADREPLDVRLARAQLLAGGERGTTIIEIKSLAFER